MKLEIFDKYTRIRIDLIRTYNYVTYENQFNNSGSFEIRIPTNEKSLTNIVDGNYIWFEDEIVGVIKTIKDVENTETEISIKGFLLNYFLTYRSFLLTTKYYDKINLIARQMFTDLFINPSDERRKIDFFKLSSDNKYNPDIEEKVRIQNTGDTLLDYLAEMFSPYNLGFSLSPNFSTTNIDSFEFRIIKPTYRTINNVYGNVPVVFSFEFGNLSQIEYEEDNSEYKSMAFVASEGIGGDRKTLEVGDTAKTGLDRIELYVDARDIQSESEESEDPLTDEELKELMQQRGLEKLSENKQYISFEATILEGKYKFNEHFSLGDFVSVIDKTTNKIYDVQVNTVTKSYFNGVEHIDIVFGNDKLTIRNLKERRVLNSV